MYSDLRRTARHSPRAFFCRAAVALVVRFFGKFWWLVGEQMTVRHGKPHTAQRSWSFVFDQVCLLKRLEVEELVSLEFAL